MAYPYLPVNPCCTDVVLNDPCGCSSVITNSGCNSNDPCSTNLTASSTIVYDGLALSCIIAEPCDTLNVILQKIDEIICNLLTQINTLTIQVNNITTQITNINGDIININNQLVDCCNATTTTTSTAAPIPCESFSLTNTGVDPVAVILTDCETQIQEAIVLMPGDTNICVVTDSQLTVPGTVIVVPNGPCGTTTTTTTIVPTTTTTTTAYPCECITAYNADVDSHYVYYTDCNGSSNQGFIINSHETIQVCGCCALATDEFVTITIGANCVNGECPVPTTTTSTTGEPTTTTTTTTIVDTCNCVDIIISQADIDDATGNTFLNGFVSIEGYIKETTCDDQDITVHYDTAGTYTHCLKTANLPYFSLYYLKDNEVVTVVQSEIVNLETSCFVDGQCIPTTTTTTTTVEPTTTTTTTTECTRPSGLITVDYFNTYTYDDITVDYTSSLLDACTACNFIYNNGPSIQEETSLFGQSGSFAVGQYVYAGLVTDCLPLANGFYITNHETCEITEIVDGYIVNISNCEITTTTTTTTIAPTTTTTTSFLGACTCFDITISQTDIDDATGNTGGYDGKVYLQTSKGSGCEGAPDISGEYSVAGTDNFCITTSFINTIQLFYYKNDVAIFYPATASTFDILYSACSVTGDCEPTTTTTTTVAPAIGCIEVTNATFSGGTSECDGTPYPITLGNVTVELLDNLGNPVIATEDITVTLAFESKQCFDPAPIPINVPVTIVTGTSLISYGYTEQIVNDCGVNDCQTLTEFFQSIVSISPSSYSLCPTTTTTTTLPPA